MSLYTTPLQLGYFFALLMWIVFLMRGIRENRLSDKLLGWVLFILAMELQDYTFGFAGINVLWNELNGFPRGVSLLFGPVVYFYFRAQVNRSFRFERNHFWHLLPYLIYFFYELSAFVQGSEIVQLRQSSTINEVLSILMRLVLIGSFVFYLSKCLNIYKAYRAWSINQFSNTELISFNWFKQFILCMIFWLFFREVMNVIDIFMDLDFYQDWWWNLALVAVVFYIGLAGYSQRQPAKIHFITKEESVVPDSPKSSIDENNENDIIANNLTTLMEKDRLYLQPELNLNELAQHLQVNSVQLSTVINQLFNKNFNDYINSLRINEFIKLHEADQDRRYTMLSLALDSGFNSKATFNRSFKKIIGKSPKEYFEESR